MWLFILLCCLDICETFGSVFWWICRLTKSHRPADPLASSHLSISATAEIHQKRSGICATIRRGNTFRLWQLHRFFFCYSFVCICRCLILSLFPEGSTPSQCVTRRLLCSHFCLFHQFIALCKDNCLQIVVDNFFFVIFLQLAATLPSKESLLLMFFSVKDTI